jgi:hypothetical protein
LSAEFLKGHHGRGHSSLDARRLNALLVSD